MSNNQEEYIKTLEEKIKKYEETLEFIRQHDLKHALLADPCIVNAIDKVFPPKTPRKQELMW